MIGRNVPYVVKEGLIRGYIFIPDDVDRTEFIEHCLRTERFSVIVDPVGVIHRCEITKGALRDIIFPKEGQKLGSAVVLLGEKNGKAMIVGVTNKQGEESFKKENIHIIKIGDDSYAALALDIQGNINIDIMGRESNGNLNINVNNPNLENKVSINCSGNIVINGENLVLNTERGEVDINSLTTSINSFETVINSKKIVFNEGEELAVLGKTLKEQLEKTNEVVIAIHEAISSWFPTGAVTDASAFKTLLESKLQGKVEGDFGEILSSTFFLK